MHTTGQAAGIGAKSIVKKSLLKKVPLVNHPLLCNSLLFELQDFIEKILRHFSLIGSNVMVMVKTYGI